MPLLLVDVKTLMNDFSENPWDFNSLEDNVKRFVDCAKNAGFSIEIIANSHYVKNPSIWKEKQLQILKENEEYFKQKPYNYDLLITNLFSLLGVKVFYPVNNSRIEVLASYASNKKALILSKSKKLAQSKENDYRLYRDFSIDSEKHVLILEKAIIPGEFKHNVNIKILKKYVFSDRWADIFLGNKFSYTKSAVGLLKEFNNPHIMIRPLRQALYKHLKINQTIHEGFVSFENGVFLWKEEKIQADEKFSFLLLKPDKAIDYFFPEINDLIDHLNEVDLKYHIYCVVSVILEICSVALETTLFELMKTYLPNFLKGFSTEDFIKKQKKVLFEKKCDEDLSNQSDSEEEKDSYREEEFKENQSNENDLKLIEKGKNWICKRCHKNFFISDRETSFHLSKDWDLPKRCRMCRRIRRYERNNMFKNPEKKIVQEMVLDVYRQGEEIKKVFKGLNKKEKIQIYNLNTNT